MISHSITRKLSAVLGILVLAAVVGCDRPSNSGPVTTSPPAPKGDVRVDRDGTRVEVDVPGDKKPAVDVKVNPGGGVDVNVDREKLREKIDERREKAEERREKRESNPE